MQSIFEISEIKQLRKNEVIFEKYNLKNMLHYEGEEFFMSTLFSNEGTISENLYYLGLDNRSSIALSDSMSDIEDEPTGSGYIRQYVSSHTGEDSSWTVTFHEDGYYIAKSSIISFIASGGSWGPVSNLFLTTESNNSGKLISTVQLESELSLSDGDVVNLRMTASLRNLVV